MREPIVNDILRACCQNAPADRIVGIKMEIPMFKTIAAAVIVVGLSLVSHKADAASVCVQSGCWVLKCPSNGGSCSWTFEKKDPFEKDTRPEK